MWKHLNCSEYFNHYSIVPHKSGFIIVLVSEPKHILTQQPRIFLNLNWSEQVLRTLVSKEHPELSDLDLLGEWRHSSPQCCSGSWSMHGDNRSEPRWWMTFWLVITTHKNHKPDVFLLMYKTYTTNYSEIVTYRKWLWLKYDTASHCSWRLKPSTDINRIMWAGNSHREIDIYSVF